MPLTLQQLFDKLEDDRYADMVAELGFCKCYVDGCYRSAHVGRIHKLSGPVDACDSHDPEKVGYALPFSVLHQQPAEEQAAPEAAPADEPQPTTEELIAGMLKEIIRLSQNGGGDGGPGKGAKLQKPKPQLPPGGVALNPLPKPVKRF